MDRPSDARAFGKEGDWKATALEAGVWVETLKEDRWRFTVARRKVEENAARHCQEKRRPNETWGVIIIQESVEPRKRHRLA